MIIGPGRFNIYLLCLLAVLVCGCRSAAKKPEKQAATLGVHLEVVKDSMDFSKTVPIFREKPVMITIDRSPFVTEANVAEAKVVDAPGGFAIQIQFDRRGTWLLEHYTTAYPGRRLAIHSTFGEKMSQARWLGAPTIQRRNSSGILTFTPDATREESEQIVLGLNNVAKKVREKSSKW